MPSKYLPDKCNLPSGRALDPTCPKVSSTWIKLFQPKIKLFSKTKFTPPPKKNGHFFFGGGAERNCVIWKQWNFMWNGNFEISFFSKLLKSTNLDSRLKTKCSFWKNLDTLLPPPYHKFMTTFINDYFFITNGAAEASFVYFLTLESAYMDAAILGFWTILKTIFYLISACKKLVLKKMRHPLN